MSTRHARIADKELNDKHTKILIQLLQNPENKKCADCRKKDPRWASWNLGIFICIRCSGTHRSLGTHISKVKSVDLDTWIPEQIENMIKWGNQRANIFWEAELNGKLPIEGNMETWIRAKYEQRKWAAPGPVPEPSMIQQTDQGNGTVAQRSKINQAKSTNTGEFDQHYHSTTSRLESRDNSATKPVTSTGKAATPPLSHTIANRLDVVSFQEQLSGLSVRGEQSPGLIPKAPPGSNMSWTNFLTAHKPADTNTTLAQTSTEKPLIPLDAFASLLKQ